MPLARKILGGRVEIRTLAVTDRPADREDVVARLSSPKGELAVLADGVTPIMHLAYVELRPGMQRGNHFHQLRHEQFYLIAGEVTLHVQDVSSGGQAEVVIRAGDLTFISPGVAHAFMPLTSGHALEFAPETFDAKDVYPHALI